MSMYSDALGFADSSRFAITIMVIYFVFILLVYAYSIVAYILQSLGLYTIAMRRGIRHPWLAWIPFGTVWIQGSIADHYQYVAKGQVKNRRKVLLGLSITMVVLYLVMFGAMIALMITGIGSEFNMAVDENQMILPSVLLLAAALVMMIIAVIMTVYQYICYYNLFQSCNPDNSATFLVLSIFFSFLLPFFVFALRKKDLGMPPKKTEVQTPVFQPVVAAPVAEPVYTEPAAEPVYAEPVADPSDFEEE